MQTKNVSARYHKLASMLIILELFIGIVGLQAQSEEPILIITHQYNCPEFIEYQWKTFKKFLHDEYIYVVFNDAQDPRMAQLIADRCNTLGVQCLRIPQNNRCQIPHHLYSPASTRHAQAIAYSMNEFGFHHDGIVMMIDSDMFLIHDFSVREFLADDDIAGLPCIQGQVMFLWPGLIFFNMKTLPAKETMQFFPGSIDGNWVDTGGYLHYYLTHNTSVKKRLFDQEGRLWITPDWHVTRWYFNRNGNLCIVNPLVCNFCKMHNYTCSHNTTILAHMGFNQKIIDAVQSKNFPPHTELILRDTFLHYKERSQLGAQGEMDDFNILKTRLLEKFLHDILEEN
jgi:hypothetical protein